MSDHEEGTFEIRDPGIDSEQIVRQVRANLVAHQHIYRNAVPLPAREGDSQSGSPSVLRYHLEQLEDSRAHIGVQRVLAPSWATQLPLIGRWWGSLRARLHELVLFYVNRAAGKQSSLNDHAIAALWTMAARIEALETRIAQFETSKEDE